MLLVSGKGTNQLPVFVVNFCPRYIRHLIGLLRTSHLFGSINQCWTPLRWVRIVGMLKLGKAEAPRDFRETGVVSLLLECRVTNPVENQDVWNPPTNETLLQMMCLFNFFNWVISRFQPWIFQGCKSRGWISGWGGLNVSKKDIDISKQDGIIGSKR